MTDFDTAFAANPLIAILRGLRPPEAADTALTLTGVGFTILEVPLNSPDPLDSISRMVAAVPGAIVGPGTVLHPDQVGAGMLVPVGRCAGHHASTRRIMASP